MVLSTTMSVQRLAAGYRQLVPAGKDLKVLAEPLFWVMGRRGHQAGIWRAHGATPPLVLSTAAPLAPLHVLIVRPDRIGDVVLNSAFLRELRRSLPAEARVTLLTRPEVRSLVERCPYVDDILTYAWDRRHNKSRRQRYRQGLAFARQHLWDKRFDLAILPRWDIDQDNSVVIAYLSGAPIRAGFVQSTSLAATEVSIRAQGGHFDDLLTHRFHRPQIEHEVKQSLAMVTLLGGQVQDESLELWLDAADTDFAQQFLLRHGWQGQAPLVALAPGAGELKREWPVERFASLAVWLQQSMNVRIVLAGGPGDRKLADVVQQALAGRGIVAAGEANLRQMAALLLHCALYIGGDTGPMHMAAAAGACVIEISCHPCDGSPASPNAPLRFRPWGEGHTVLQPATALPPCRDQCQARDAHCITQITLEQVQAAVVEQWTRVTAIQRTPPQTPSLHSRPSLHVIPA